MQVKTVKSLGAFRTRGIKIHLWKVVDKYFRAEIYRDGVCQLFWSNEDGHKLGDNLVGHNTDGVGDCKRRALELVKGL